MIVYFLVLFIALLLALLFYFKVARHFGIIDKPNERSSHIRPTIRGGGIIFPLSFLFYSIWFVHYDAFLLGAIGISTLVSFWDDIRPLHAYIRLPMYALASGLVILASGLSNFEVGWLILTWVAIVGFTNAYNFMDGINGISSLYAIVFLGTAVYLHYFTPLVMPVFLIWTLLIATAIFSFFNVRKKAICFAGDVGVIPLALLIAYIWLELFNYDMNPIWILLLAVYGVDSFATIIFRWIRKEPLHKPHRHHTYQNLANEWGWSHLSVALLYACLQLLVNAIIILTIDIVNPWIMILAILSSLSTLYIWIKRSTLARYSLPFYGK